VVSLNIIGALVKPAAKAKFSDLEAQTSLLCESSQKSAYAANIVIIFFESCKKTTNF
jgi:hypothetical protein